jgi:two-component system chemotaxis response regulator CheB
MEAFTGFTMQAVVIGASTGGTPVVESLLRALPADLPAPVAVCQHMPDGFTAQWAARLDKLCWLDVREAREHERFVRGTVYVAPAGRHMRIVGTPAEARIRFDADSGDAFYVPSIDMLMTSAAAVFRHGVLGVVLSGIGNDGARGLLEIRRAGGRTIVESPNSAAAAAASMPEAAIGLGAAEETVDTGALPRTIVARVTGAAAGR